MKSSQCAFPEIFPDKYWGQDPASLELQETIVGDKGGRDALLCLLAVQMIRLVAMFFFEFLIAGKHCLYVL